MFSHLHEPLGVREWFVTLLLKFAGLQATCQALLLADFLGHLYRFKAAANIRRGPGFPELPG
jgi:hypothetical protein